VREFIRFMQTQCAMSCVSATNNKGTNTRKSWSLHQLF